MYGSLEDHTRSSRLPAELLARLDVIAPGFRLARLGLWDSWLNSQLSKRYDTTKFAADPTATPPVETPPVLLLWQFTLTDFDCWVRLGRSSTDEDIQTHAAAVERVQREVADAASGQSGAYDIQLSVGLIPTTVINRPGPLIYTESSPFLAQRRQREQGRQEDQQGSGTFYGRRR